MKNSIKIMAICFLSFLGLTSTNAQNSNPWPTSGPVGIGTATPSTNVLLDLVPPSLNKAYGLNDTTVLQNWGVCNIFTGVGTGFSLNGGAYDCFNGWKAGYNNTTGTSNTFIGHVAGYTNVDALVNT